MPFSLLLATFLDWITGYKKHFLYWIKIQFFDHWKQHKVNHDKNTGNGEKYQN